MVLLAAVLALVVLSCGDSAEDASSTSLPSARSAATDDSVVGGAEIAAATGGTVMSADGNLVVDIPAGALSEDTAISITRLDPSDWPEGFAEGTVVGGVYDLQPGGLIFDEPVTITHRITEADIDLNFDADVPLTLMVVMSDDGAGEAATNQLIIRDGDDLIQSGEVNHFSVTALFGGLITVTFTPNYLQRRVGEEFEAIVGLKISSDVNRNVMLDFKYSGVTSGSVQVVLLNLLPENPRARFLCSAVGDGRYGVNLSAGEYVNVLQRPALEQFFHVPPTVFTAATVEVAVMTGSALCREKPSSLPPGTRVEITASFSPTPDTSASCGAEFIDTLGLEYDEDATGTIGWLGDAERLPFTITGGVLLAEKVIPGEEGLDTLWRYEINIVTGEITVTYELVPPATGLGCAYAATVDAEQLAAQLLPGQ